jgi:hypothetical protein
VRVRRSTRPGRVHRRVGALCAVAIVVLGCGDGGGPVARTSWWLAAEPGGRQVELTVLVASSACERFDGVRVTERVDRVELIATVRVTETGAACVRDLTTLPVTVALDHPLGGRSLTGCQQRDDRLYPRPVACDVVSSPGPAPRVGELRPAPTGEPTS